MRGVRPVDDVPVLFAISGDPVELGIANSLARPGRNFTGGTFLSLEIAGRRVELLKQALRAKSATGSAIVVMGWTCS